MEEDQRYPNVCKGSIKHLSRIIDLQYISLQAFPYERTNRRAKGLRVWRQALPTRPRRRQYRIIIDYINRTPIQSNNRDKKTGDLSIMMQDNSIAGSPYCAALPVHTPNPLNAGYFFSKNRLYCRLLFKTFKFCSILTRNDTLSSKQVGSRPAAE